MKIVFVGEGAVGKTAMIHQYMTGEILEDYTPGVLEFSYEKDLFFNKTSTKLSLWDTYGQDAYDRLRPLSYPGATLFVILFSIPNRHSFEDITKKWLPEVRHYCANTPVLLMGMRCDLREKPEAFFPPPALNSLITYEEGKKLAQGIGAVAYLECSTCDPIVFNGVFNRIIEIAFFQENISKSIHRHLFLENACCSYKSYPIYDAMANPFKLLQKTRVLKIAVCNISEKSSLQSLLTKFPEEVFIYDYKVKLQFDIVSSNNTSNPIASALQADPHAVILMGKIKNKNTYEDVKALITEFDKNYGRVGRVPIIVLDVCLSKRLSYQNRVIEFVEKMNISCYLLTTLKSYDLNNIFAELAKEIFYELTFIPPQKQLFLKHNLVTESEVSRSLDNIHDQEECIVDLHSQISDLQGKLERLQRSHINPSLTIYAKRTVQEENIINALSDRLAEKLSQLELQQKQLLEQVTHLQAVTEEHTQELLRQQQQLQQGISQQVQIIFSNDENETSAIKELQYLVGNLVNLEISRQQAWQEVNKLLSKEQKMQQVVQGWNEFRKTLKKYPNRAQYYTELSMLLAAYLKAWEILLTQLFVHSKGRAQKCVRIFQAMAKALPLIGSALSAAGKCVDFFMGEYINTQKLEQAHQLVLHLVSATHANTVSDESASPINPGDIISEAAEQYDEHEQQRNANTVNMTLNSVSGRIHVDQLSDEVSRSITEKFAIILDSLTDASSNLPESLFKRAQRKIKKSVVSSKTNAQQKAEKTLAIVMLEIISGKIPVGSAEELKKNLVNVAIYQRDIIFDTAVTNEENPTASVSKPPQVNEVHIPLASTSSFFESPLPDSAKVNAELAASRAQRAMLEAKVDHLTELVKNAVEGGEMKFNL